MISENLACSWPDAGHRMGRVDAADGVRPTAQLLCDQPDDRRRRRRIEERRGLPRPVVAEREGGHEERAARAETGEERLDHRFRPSLDPAERAQRAVHEEQVAPAHAELVDVVRDSLLRDDRRGLSSPVPRVGRRFHGHDILYRMGDAIHVLAVSVHPDDETLGCGGSLLAHRDRGDALDWLILTSPDERRHRPDVVAEKTSQVEAVAQAYGMRTTTQLPFAAGRLDLVSFSDLMREVGAVIQRVRPALVYVVSPGDVHTDHGVGFGATMSVLKPFHMRALGVRRVESFETLSSTEAAATPSFVPNVFRDVSATIGEKLRVMSLYATEAQPEPLPRSPSAIRALGRLRGATIGVEHAEAFSLVRELAS